MKRLVTATIAAATIAGTTTPAANATEPLSAIWNIISQINGAPYIRGGHSPAGADCSGLASIIANTAVGRDPYGSRFDTATEAAALTNMGFQWGSQQGALNIGWNNIHTAVTLPDGTPIESGGTGGGIHTAGQGAFQPQFTNHMYLWLPA